MSVVVSSSTGSDFTYSVVISHEGYCCAISDRRPLTNVAFSDSLLAGSSSMMSTTSVSEYSAVSSQFICMMARCILMPRKYLGLRAMERVALKVMVPLMFGAVASRR